MGDAKKKRARATPMPALIVSLLLSKFSIIVMPLIVLGFVLATLKKSLRLVGWSIIYAAGAAYAAPAVRQVIASYSSVAAEILASMAALIAGVAAAGAILYAVLTYILTEDAEKAKKTVPVAIGALVALLTHLA